MNCCCVRQAGTKTKTKAHLTARCAAQMPTIVDITEATAASEDDGPIIEELEDSLEPSNALPLPMTGAAEKAASAAATAAIAAVAAAEAATANAESAVDNAGLKPKEDKPVELIGLKSQGALNGRRARTLKWDASCERMGVALDDGSKIAVKLANLKFLDSDDADDAKTGVPPTPSPTAGAPLQIAIAGAEFDALRPALEARGFASTSDIGASAASMRKMASASIADIVALLSAPDPGGEGGEGGEGGALSSAAAQQALAVLASVGAGQGRVPLLSREVGGAAAATKVMRTFAADAPVQASGLRLLGALAAGGGAAGRHAVVEAGGVACAARAIERHAAEAGVEVGRAGCVLLQALAEAEQTLVAEPLNAEATVLAAEEPVLVIMELEEQMEHTALAAEVAALMAAVQTAGEEAME